MGGVAIGTSIEKAVREMGRGGSFSPLYISIYTYYICNTYKLAHLYTHRELRAEQV